MGGVEAEAVGFPGVRLTVDQADETLRRVADRLAPNRPVLQRDEFNILALSGGAAGGAFGAGVLVGWTKTGERPEFDIVTGVSTGALTAPFAYLGPDWDKRLTEAYTSDAAERILDRRGLDILFRPSFYTSNALRALVETYVDPPLLYAIGVMQVELDARGQVRHFGWLRAPKHAPEVMAEIERTVRRAAPYPAPARLGKVTYTETWLWDKSGRFQLDTLTEGQRSEL